MSHPTLLGGHFIDRSRTVTVLCLWHKEKEPSLCIWKESGRYLCHGCGRAGRPLHLAPIAPAFHG